MSNRQHEEPAFSTDSFLDVVCNLVGILIVLIIVAGLRVGHGPALLTSNQTAPAAPDGSRQEWQPTSQRAGIRMTEISGWLELAPDAPTETPPAELPPTDLVSQADQLRQQVALLAKHNAELDSRVDAARQTRLLTDEQLRRLNAELELARTQTRESTAAADAAARSVRLLEEQAAQLTARTAAIADQPVASQVLKHSVTPISRLVSDKDELHFRLSGNRVSVVPLDSLAEALKFRMERSRDMFFRVNRYEGTAGPVDGFLMRYVVEKQQPSAIEELRNGGPYMRIQLAYYELEAGPDVVSETADEALGPGSRFLTALATVRPGTSLTFWVYPDSFDVHRQLQAFAHEARFDVAARPLPVGVPIAGSPNGSRSAAQ